MIEADRRPTMPTDTPNTPRKPGTPRATHTTHSRRTNVLLAFRAFAEGQLAAGTAPKGLERAFAEHLQIKPALWSMAKSGARPIGDKLARQIEAGLGKPAGWLDEEHAEPVLTSAEQHAMALALAAYRRTNAAGRRQLLGLLKTYT
jgi:hypothetical protein